MELTEDQMYEIRDRFYKRFNVDLRHIDDEEIVDYLELLPLALVWIHQEYDLAKVHKVLEEKEME